MYAARSSLGSIRLLLATCAVKVVARPVRHYVLKPVGTRQSGKPTGKEPSHQDLSYLREADEHNCGCITFSTSGNVANAFPLTHGARWASSA